MRILEPFCLDKKVRTECPVDLILPPHSKQLTRIDCIVLSQKHVPPVLFEITSHDIDFYNGVLKVLVEPNNYTTKTTAVLNLKLDEKGCCERISLAARSIIPSSSDTTYVFACVYIEV